MGRGTLRPRRVLIISYYFPPGNFIAALRAGKLAKYLQQHYWEPWVLTVEQGLFPSAGALPVEIQPEHVIRADLGKWLTARAKRRRCQTVLTDPNKRSNQTTPLTLSRLARLRGRAWASFSGLFTDIRFPDRALPWVLPAIVRGTDLLRHVPFDVIFSSHGPPSSHLVAAALSGRFNLPWVADFRDLWSQNHIQRRFWPLQPMETQLERWVLRRVAQLTTVSAPLAQQLQALHGKPVSVIPNGFDPDDFNLTEPTADQRFRIVYTGMIYPGKQDPAPLFAAIRQLHSTHPALALAIEVHFLGSDPALVMAVAEVYGMVDQVVVHPRLDNRQAIRWQWAADLLLLLEWNDPAARGVYTGKVFEYLGARRPILAIGVPGGVVESLLRETQSGLLATDAPAAAGFILRHWTRKHEDGTTRLPERNGLLEPYTRRHQASILARVLDHVANGI